jgi:hypothetical protein
MADLYPLSDWSGSPATLTIWHPSSKSITAAKSAPISPIAPSYEQVQHLDAFFASNQRQEQTSRLLIFVWEEHGQCEHSVMSEVITNHLCRHDTYHSWFEKKDNTIFRHVLTDPETIAMEASTFGEATALEWQRLIAETPGSFEWDCFRFGILQRAASFTFFACIDHLHADSTVIAFLTDEIHSCYRSLVAGDEAPPIAKPGRYLDYCTAQHQRAANMTLTDPSVSEWVSFMLRNDGRMPAFPLPLGTLEYRSLAEYRHEQILDAVEVTRFESLCYASGARMIGGLLACAAQTDGELTGNNVYSVITPTTTRESAEALRTTGWCMGVVPIDFEIGQCAFPELAVIAQDMLNNRKGLARIPIERVFELAAPLHKIRPVATGGVMLSFMNMNRFLNRFSLDANIANKWQNINGRIYINQGSAAQVGLWFFQTKRGLTLTAAYPANPIARASMQAYVEALKAACRRVVNTRC